MPINILQPKSKGKINKIKKYIFILDHNDYLLFIMISVKKNKYIYDYNHVSK